MPKTYELRVSREGIIKSLKDQFTNRFTFLGEALQNARRAGANHIEINFDANQLVLDIIDNGNGIEDFDKLLTLGESGWDMEKLASEYPYGVGFASLLMAADAVEITTGEHHTRFFTDDVLNFKPMQVDAAVRPVRGTHLRLWLRLSYINEPVEHTLKSRVIGFPTPVFFNGKPLERPAATDSDRTFVDTPIGKVSLPAWDDGVPKKADIRAFVQGLPVEFVNTRPDPVGKCVIVHFASHVRARMPDRDKLIEERPVRNQTDDIINDMYADYLKGIKSRISPEAFADGYWEACARWCPELLSDAPLVASMIQRCQDVQQKLEDWHHDNDEWLVSWDADEPVPNVDQLFLRESFDDEQQEISLYATKAKLPVLRHNLPDTHPATRNLIDADDLPITFRLVEERKEVTFNGDWIWVGVQFCNAVELSLDESRLSDFSEEMRALLRETIKPIVVDDMAFYDEELGLIIPEKLSSFYALPGLCSSYLGKFDEYKEGAYERNENALASLVQAVMAKNPAEYLTRQINAMGLDSSLFEGGAYELRYDDESCKFIVTTMAA